MAKLWNMAGGFIFRWCRLAKLCEDWIILGEEEDEEITEDKKVEMLAEYLKDYIEEEADMAGLNGFLDALLTSAISEIDFTELATAFLDVW